MFYPIPNSAIPEVILCLQIILVLHGLPHAMHHVYNNSLGPSLTPSPPMQFLLPRVR